MLGSALRSRFEAGATWPGGHFRDTSETLPRHSFFRRSCLSRRRATAATRRPKAAAPVMAARRRGAWRALRMR